MLTPGIRANRTGQDREETGVIRATGLAAQASGRSLEAQRLIKKYANRRYARLQFICFRSLRVTARRKVVSYLRRVNE